MWPARSLLLVAALACFRAKASSENPEPFTFSYGSRVTSDGGQLIEAAVAPDGESVPTTFRLELTPPGLAADAGATIRAVMRRGEPEGASYLLVMLGPTFYDLPPTSGSGALVAIDLSTHVTDSLSLLLTVRSPLRTGRWLAEARLTNGGRFSVALDDRTKRGEFRRIDPIADTRVFMAIAGLLARR
jgi:hypothetical protein